MPDLLATSDVLGTGWYAAHAANTRDGFERCRDRGRAVVVPGRSFRKGIGRGATGPPWVIPAIRGSLPKVLKSDDDRKALDPVPGETFQRQI